MDLMSKAAGYAIQAAVQSSFPSAGPRLPIPSNYDGPATTHGLSSEVPFTGVNGPFGTPTKPVAVTPPRNPTKPGQINASTPTKPAGTFANVGAQIRDLVSQGQTAFTIYGPKGGAHAIDTVAQTNNGKPWSQRALDWFANLGSDKRSDVASSSRGGGTLTPSQATPVASNPSLNVNLNNPVIVRPTTPNVPKIPPLVTPPTTTPQGNGGGSGSGSGGSGTTSSPGGPTTSTNTGGGGSAGSGNTGTDTTQTTGNQGLDQTLADIFSQVFGTGVGFTPQVADSGGQVLVVPGEGAAGEGNGNAMLGLLAIGAVVGIGYYLYKRRKGATSHE